MINDLEAQLGIKSHDKLLTRWYEWDDREEGIHWNEEEENENLWRTLKVHKVDEREKGGKLRDYRYFMLRFVKDMSKRWDWS